MGNMYFKVMVQAWNEDKFLTGESADQFLNSIVENNSPGSSNWFKSLRIFVNSEAKNIVDYIRGYKIKYQSGQINSKQYQDIVAGAASSLTVRQCPGIKELMNRSLIIKSPCDILIEIDNNQLRENLGNSPIDVNIADPTMINIVSHHPSQWHSPIDKHNVMKNKLNVKFVFPVNMYSEKNKPWIFTNPAYHHNSQLDVLPGGIFGSYTRGQGLIINTVYNIKDNEDKTLIKINQGDPIAYMVFPEKMKIKRTEKTLFGLFRTKFGQSVKIF